MSSTVLLHLILLVVDCTSPSNPSVVDCTSPSNPYVGEVQLMTRRIRRRSTVDDIRIGWRSAIDDIRIRWRSSRRPEGLDGEAQPTTCLVTVYTKYLYYCFAGNYPRYWSVLNRQVNVLLTRYHSWICSYCKSYYTSKGVIPWTAFTAIPCLTGSI
jgi:hypothetical protein